MKLKTAILAIVAAVLSLSANSAIACNEYDIRSIKSDVEKIKEGLFGKNARIYGQEEVEADCPDISEIRRYCE